MKIVRVQDLLLGAETSAKKFNTEVWWRGQTEDWPLLPGVYRPDLCPISPQTDLERSLTIRFLLDAKTRHHHWPDGDHSLQLALMQHYRLPTRLLDWTESPLFGLFFATRNKDDKPGVLWALSPSALNQEDFGTEQFLSPSRDDVSELFKAPFGLSDTHFDKVGALAFMRIDARMAAQLSTLTIHGSREPLERRKESERHLLKFVIPANEKPSLRMELVDLGIRESILFPDLDHLAEELKRFAKQGILSSKRNSQA